MITLSNKCIHFTKSLHLCLKYFLLCYWSKIGIFFAFNVCIFLQSAFLRLDVHKEKVQEEYEPWLSANYNTPDKCISRQRTKAKFKLRFYRAFSMAKKNLRHYATVVFQTFPIADLPSEDSQHCKVCNSAELPFSLQVFPWGSSGFEFQRYIGWNKVLRHKQPQERLESLATCNILNLCTYPKDNETIWCFQDVISGHVGTFLWWLERSV